MAAGEIPRHPHPLPVRFLVDKGPGAFISFSVKWGYKSRLLSGGLCGLDRHTGTPAGEQPTSGSPAEGIPYSQLITKVLEEVENQPGDHPEFGSGKKLPPRLGEMGQRDKVMSPGPKNPCSPVGLGSQR